MVPELGERSSRTPARAGAHPGRGPGHAEDAPPHPGDRAGLPAQRTARHATKIHLKHVSVATTEGYASRPGGAQAELLAEVNKHESERNLDLVWAEFRNYQQGVMPAGPGARELTACFAQIDSGLEPDTAASPKIQHGDREVLNLLSKRAKTLHLATANYCWFTDPSR